MKPDEFIKAELSGWGKYERIIFPLVLVLIIIISVYTNDNKIALISAICGISYTVLAGKGKISCYIFGLTGTLCYAFIAYKNSLYGNLALYLLYYFPMQVIGIFKWKNYLQEKTNEIVKTKLSKQERVLYGFLTIIFTLLFILVLKTMGDANPIIDAITSIFSITGLVLTVKRCIEQWYLWTIVNALSILMWSQAYLNGSNCFATILMWCVYLFLGLYFLMVWRRDLKSTEFQTIN